ncbi:MAG: hypothetical protein ACRDYX_04155, partial [Egibacteraceae bacterium]
MTKGSFYERLAGHGHEIVTDDGYAHLYAQRTGRRSVPPSVTVRAMLCAAHDRTSDAETSRRTRVDADRKAATGADDGFAGIAAATFAPVPRPDGPGRRRPGAVRQDVGEGGRRGDRQRRAVCGRRQLAGARRRRGRRHLRAGPRVCVQAGPGCGRRLDRGAAARLGPLLGPLCEAKADVGWQDPGARRAVLGELAGAACELRQAVAGIDDAAVVELAGLPDQVVDQDAEEGVDGQPTIRQG